MANPLVFIFHYFFNKDYRFFFNSIKLGFHKNMDDEEYLSRLYKYNFNYFPNLLHPTTFNEKLQYLKLHDKKNIYTKMVDKYEAKIIVGKAIGTEYIIKNYGVWDIFDEIDFNKLPNSFVLKCTHDSGGVVICKNKQEFDFKQARKKISKALKNNFYYSYREWPYKNVKPRIIAEEYLEIEGGVKDYKVHCFNGNPKLILVCSDRFSKNGIKEDFFDNNWSHLPVKRPNIPNCCEEITKPLNFDIMIKLSSILSMNTPFLRVDWYEYKGRLLFGELTFYPASGLRRFEPPEWDLVFGEWIKI